MDGGHSDDPRDAFDVIGMRQCISDAICSCNKATKHSIHTLFLLALVSTSCRDPLAQNCSKKSTVKLQIRLPLMSLLSIW